jgi:hypothetical protein
MFQVGADLSRDPVAGDTENRGLQPPLQLHPAFWKARPRVESFGLHSPPQNPKKR